MLVPALCFPAVKGSSLNALSMNWTCLIYGGAMMFAMIYYAVSGRKWFKGPRLNVGVVTEGDAMGEKGVGQSAGSDSGNTDESPIEEVKI